MLFGNLPVGLGFLLGGVLKELGDLAGKGFFAAGEEDAGRAEGFGILILLEDDDVQAPSPHTSSPELLEVIAGCREDGVAAG